MNITRDRIRSVGWAIVLVICLALTVILTLRVNAVKSEVHDTEKRIVGLKQEILFLETEFQTRSNQQQLKALNDVEFGYSAPRAEQYIEGERQLAALGKPRGPDAPAPILVASNIETQATPGTILAIVSPLLGGTARAEEGGLIAATADGGSVREQGGAHKAAHSEDLSTRLARIDLPKAGGE